MNEVEAKILEIDESSIEKQLVALGAQKTFEGEVEWLVFDFPNNSLSENEVLVRLRKLGSKTELTVKKLISTEKAKISQESEVIVDDFVKATLVLESIGLKQKKGYPLKKYRISYLLNDVHFEIDTFAKFPTYLEIEAPDNTIIEANAKKLGFSIADIKPWGTREVFTYYRNKA